MNLQRVDTLILGAGVVGLSTGIALLRENPKLSVAIFDKEKSLGLHASGRNSGVLHAGFYYSPESLKAKFCREGNFALRELCARHEIPVRACGKVVVTRNEGEEIRLETLFSRGVKNGVQLEILEARDLHKFEPLAKTYQRFMWSPNTAISDSNAVIQALAKEYVALGGELFLGKTVSLEENSEKIRSKGGDISFRHLVNCSGAQADRVAKTLNAANEYAMVPFMGVYRVTEAASLPLRTLVYPVPHQINPFLGVHFTLTLDGRVKIGPTAIPVLGREQYSWKEGWSTSDLVEAAKGTLSLIRGKSHDFSELVKSEWPKIFERRLVSEASELVPGATTVKKWVRKPPGIRAQLVHLPTGRLEQDFVIRNFLNSTHVLNAVSPGWTSSIPFGKHVAESFVLPNL